ncbi:tetratricopeptide repeat protein [Kribbella sp. NPDC006257]|uniref:tetratricopeptide repeat protein n=1 Tax=Kribbella sp. NPDC006257 TaxID=3156738 RepID=UPI0033AA9F9C
MNPTSPRHGGKNPEIGDHLVAVNAGVGLGDVHFDLGRLDEAAGRYLEALQTAERIGSRAASIEEPHGNGSPPRWPGWAGPRRSTG